MNKTRQQMSSRH